MSRNNRQRRQEKHRKRDRRRSERSQAPSGPAGIRYDADAMPTDFLVRAAALAAAEGDSQRAAGLGARAAARPDARKRTAEVLDRHLAELGEDGWEPPLVANLVRRRLGPRHARLLDGVAEADDVQWAIELLALLLSLPPLPALPKADRVDGADARILAKVRGLLAKAESTTFPDEAEALSAKAQELMARHAISAVLARPDSRPETPGGRRIPLEDPYADAKSLLLSAVARANRCRSVQVVGLAHATVLGFETDLVAVELLFTSLLVQASRAMLAAGRDDRRARQRGFRSSFLSAYGMRVGQRLEASTAAEVTGADEAHHGRLLPVLAARSDAVEDAVHAMFGHGLTSRPARISDHHGWVAGHAAADLADLAVGPEVRATAS